MLKRFTDFVLQSRFQAMMAAFVCAFTSLASMHSDNVLLSVFVLLISTFSIVIVAFVTLRKGLVEGAFVLLAALLPYLIGYVLYSDYYALGLVWVSALIVWGSNVLTWIGAGILRRYASWSITLQVLTFICIVGVCIVYVLCSDPQGWWAAQLTESFTKAMEMSGLSAAQEITEQKAAIVDTVARAKLYATASAVLFVWFNAALQLLLARAWQATLFNPGGLRKELYEIRMSYAAGVLLIGGSIFSFWQNNALIADIMPVLYVMFGVAGLSLLHKIAASLKTGWILLMLFYVAIPVTILVIPMLALLDVWLDFRKRLEKPV